MRNAINRRELLRQGSLALAGLTFAGAFTATANTERRGRFTPPGVIRLTSNENPYGPSPLARSAMADAIASSNRYPWDNTTVLGTQLARHYGLTDEHVLIGAGSTEILALVAQYTALAKGNVITANPTFGTCTRTAEALGVQIIKVPLTADKKYDLPGMLRKLNNETKLVYVCNPNNPTGTTLPSADVKSFVEEVSKKTLVLLDEAYIEYCDQPSLAGMVANNKNLVIAKTFSKIYGLAGARIGYALAHPETINKLSSIQAWPNGSASAVSVAAAMASLQDKDFLTSTKDRNRQASAYTMKELQSMGFTCIPSETNFLYYSIRSFNGNWADQLRAKNILTGRIVEEEGKWTRTTIGTMEEMQSFISAIKQIKS